MKQAYATEASMPYASCHLPVARERAMRFELTTFSLARRRSTAELRPHRHSAGDGQELLCCRLCPRRWTRSDSNRRSPPCKGGAFPLGHGPVLTERPYHRSLVNAQQPYSSIFYPGCWISQDSMAWLVPTGRFELPRPLGHQILSLTRLPVPPRRQSGAKHHSGHGRETGPSILETASWMYPRFCLGRHLSLRPCGPRPVLACRVLPGLTVPAATRPNPTGPGPLALLPVARSPSRRHCCHRWWALTPPFQP
jgi:hypothetical protein